MARVRRVRLDMEGILQGVGFRPAMQRHAVAAGLGGLVQNRSGRVRLELVGEEAAVASFVDGIEQRLPPQARLDRLDVTELEIDGSVAEGALEFRIVESSSDAESRVSIPADLAICRDCMREVFAEESRFFGYPFTTCTNCGPRYTVVDGMPYDRERTSLSRFPLCDDCTAEYSDPTNRRFHAESIACPRCGPRVWLADRTGARAEGEPLREVRRALAAGQIVAIKGLGGFLLAADPRNAMALAQLRARKHRPAKPFAVMARDLDVVRGIAIVDAPAERLMTDPAAPIAILDLAPGALSAGLAVDELSPDTATLGVMLPTTPLHALLFNPLPQDPTPAFDLLVMTSGNRGGEPICTRNDEALERLAGIADLFLLHDRPINLRCDDSLCALTRGGPQVWRRARGFAPGALRLRSPLPRRVLAMGAELKNTVGVGFDSEVVLSPHIGDLETPEALDSLEEVAECLPRFLEREPQVVAVDLHPDMHSTRVGRRIAAARGLPVVSVQHHHAHGVAALAESGHDRARALVFDGTGLGEDGTIWGAELLVLDGLEFARRASFRPAPLPGGDAAVREPARALLARWLMSGREIDRGWLERLGVEVELLAILQLQCERGLNAPKTHAAGRVFDAVSAALGASPRRISYEGQPAIRLESLARECTRAAALPECPFALEEDDGLLLVDWSGTFDRLYEASVERSAAADWAASFHEAMALAARAMLRETTCDDEGPVLLTGGVFMNRLLVERLSALAAEDGIEVWLPRVCPPNDGGIAMGQACVAGGSI